MHSITFKHWKTARRGALILAAVFIAAGSSQAEDQKTDRRQRGAVLTGCLQSIGGRLVLTDETTGKTVEVSGPDLDKNTGGKVELSGSMVPEIKPVAQASEVFQVTKVARISKSCAKPQAGAGFALGATTAKTAEGVPRVFVIGVGDILQVSVWQEPDASAPAVQVRSDGRITLPFVKEITARGLTTSELETIITERLQPFLKNPQVSVMMKEINSEKIYVFGAVKREGAIPLKLTMTILQALAEAGGLTDYAKRSKIFILREDGGKQVRLSFNYDAVIKGENTHQNIHVVAGDTIVVPR